MGLREDLAADVVGAFQELGNIVESVTYTSVTTGSYDPSTGSPTKVETPVVVGMVFSPADSGAVADPNIQYQSFSGDLVGIARTAEFGSVVPRTGDRVTRGTASLQVVGVKQDPAGATYEVLLRKAES